MRGHGEKLSRKKEAVIKSLLENDTVAAAAKAANISEATAWRWMKAPEFKEAFREAKKRVLDYSIGRLQHATRTAINALISIVSDEKAPASARVSGAKTILEMAVKVAEIEDLESRVGKLEQMKGERSSGIG